jgi:uncharacterized protein
MSSASKALIDIRVQPRSSQSRIVAEADQIKVYLNSPPADGKANEECIRLFAEKLRVPKSRICIAKGEKNRNKTIGIDNVTREEVLAALRS